MGAALLTPDPPLCKTLQEITSVLGMGGCTDAEQPISTKSTYLGKVYPSQQGLPIPAKSTHLSKVYPLWGHFSNCALYGSWEPLDSAERLSRGVGTFCPPGKPVGTTFICSTFCVTFRDVQLFRTLQPISQPISALLIHFQ